MAEETFVDPTDLEFVRACYNDFNEQYFSGELPEVKFTTVNDPDYVSCLYRKVDMRNHRLIPTRIEFSTADPMTEDEFRNALVHEMIHVSACLQPFSDIPPSVWRQAEQAKTPDERDEILGLTQEGDHGNYFALMQNALNGQFKELNIETQHEKSR